MNESAELQYFLLTSIVRVIAAAEVPASLHCRLSAALRWEDTSQTTQDVRLQNMSSYRI